MSTFLEQARDLLATAKSGAGDAELAVVVDRAGGIQVVAAWGWDAEALRLDRGARWVFRISRSGGRVRLEGRSRGEGCRLEAGVAAPHTFPSAADKNNAGQDFPQGVHYGHHTRELEPGSGFGGGWR